ncbi:hypothetical protein L873DRAFT_1756457 [Choiromyces venosus 120613-1]|uniref:Uncharacterized protein n=1 Tax=Choiromyces venosus 120613-1 TaxID=1336337 RepID=A0A3N4K653_9PEZI|nr:hypothetical protein L873DRAFT_1756457 [Choiromyces venosus 120613-1]
MPLDTADNDNDMPVSDSDPFGGDSDPYASSSTGNYPPPLGLAPLSGLLGYSETNRDFFVRTSLTQTAVLLGLKLTPVEREGLTYYNSRFYSYESYGDVLGITAGILIAFLLRNRKPGPISNAMVSVFTKPGAQRENAARWLSRGLKLSVWGSVGRMYGLTSAGFQAIQKNKAEKRVDPNLSRVVAMADRKKKALVHEIQVNGPELRRMKDLETPKVRRDDDGQSLGGMEISDETESRLDASEKERFPYGRPSEQVAELEARKRGGGDDDAFGVDDASSTGGEGVMGQGRGGGWTNTHSNTGESTWERIRKGQSPTARPPTDRTEDEASTTGLNEPKARGWPNRPPMKGYAQATNREPGTDSFSFSNSEEERQLAKQEAQKEFDAKIEKERSGQVGDGYVEGDSENRRWGK